MKSRGTALIAGWSSPVARQAHNLKVVGSNPAPATNKREKPAVRLAFFFLVSMLLFFWGQSMGQDAGKG